MTGIHVYLENGFDHDLVVLVASEDHHTDPDVTTRHQVGLATVVELDVPSDARATVQITVPERGLSAEVGLDPAATPHVRVNVTDGSLDVLPQATPPMFA
ncbi:hypothetical protein IEZ26_22785 [Nocardioides cavernae]|uniref:ArsA HSP20-like domain-containing protein n=1 Tax=Nocardioides cavernae TaxID=1921566 RepID=A0ABR8NH75_9ACTN|nr:hypothetical protein [Nocardioides cavernae]MBD3927467.1 hypothetical protein [Nocardioides cavernae]MBM7513212.1 hypothetical protein [Nocardioides cavernae]